jgi:hypothetical protein
MMRKENVKREYIQQRLNQIWWTNFICPLSVGVIHMLATLELLNLLVDDRE